MITSPSPSARSLRAGRSSAAGLYAGDQRQELARYSRISS